MRLSWSPTDASAGAFARVLSAGVINHSVDELVANITKPLHEALGDPGKPYITSDAESFSETVEGGGYSSWLVLSARSWPNVIATDWGLALAEKTAADPRLARWSENRWSMAGPLVRSELLFSTLAP